MTATTTKQQQRIRRESASTLGLESRTALKCWPVDRPLHLVGFPTGKCLTQTDASNLAAASSSVSLSSPCSCSLTPPTNILNHLFFSSPPSINSYTSTKVYINCTPNRSFARRANGNSPGSILTNNSNNSLLVSPLNSPKPRRLNSNSNDLLDANPPGSPNSQPYWKSRLNTLKQSFLGTPRFHRRKMQGNLSVIKCNHFTFWC